MNHTEPSFHRPRCIDVVCKVQLPAIDFAQAGNNHLPSHIHEILNVTTYSASGISGEMVCPTWVDTSRASLGVERSNSNSISYLHVPTGELPQ